MNSALSFSFKHGSLLAQHCQVPETESLYKDSTLIVFEGNSRQLFTCWDRTEPKQVLCVSLSLSRQQIFIRTTVRSSVFLISIYVIMSHKDLSNDPFWKERVKKICFIRSNSHQGGAALFIWWAIEAVELTCRMLASQLASLLTAS